MKYRKLSHVIVCLIIAASEVSAFGVDFCFTSAETIQNCIVAEEVCRVQPTVDTANEITCRVGATANSMSGLSGTNTIIGGRNSIHTDSTYLMAQLIGFSAWQAYQMMIYSEATDQSQYIPFSQSSVQMLTDTEITECDSKWGLDTMPNHCLAMTPVLNGIYKFNSQTGGMLLHLHARSMTSNEAPPVLGYPTDYLSETNSPNENLLRNFRDWVFGARLDACAAGITTINATPDASFLPCASSSNVLNSPISFFAAGFSRLKIPFVTTLGTFIINQGTNGATSNTLATDDSLSSYITPHEVAYAKMGMFIHTYEDRYSHHMCTDTSYTYPLGNGDYNSVYDDVTCAQGSHFWWHVLEQGTTQSNIEEKHRTMESALSTAYNELVNYAIYKGIPINEGAETAAGKAAILASIMPVVQITEPQARLDAMVALMEAYGVMPLPGHGSVPGNRKTLDEWLAAAGAIS